MNADTNPKDAIGDKKVNLALVPPASIIHEAMALEDGAAKYNPFNWRSKKVRAMVYVAAGLRHLLEYLDGADYSSDSNPPVHHLGHAKACMGIVLDALETGNLVDDRPAKGAASRLLVARSTKVSVPTISNEPDAVSGFLDVLAEKQRTVGAHGRFLD